MSVGNEASGATIVVCPLSRLEETVADWGARDLVTLLAPGSHVPSPPSCAGRHLVLNINDIAMELGGHVLAGSDHVEELVAFVQGWGRATPLVIHCYAGISRSTAAAFITLCTLAPSTGEAAHAAALRAASPTATPNRRLVAVADDMLGRDGRMVAAIDGIGRGAEAYEGTPFALAVP